MQHIVYCVFKFIVDNFNLMCNLAYVLKLEDIYDFIML